MGLPKKCDTRYLSPATPNESRSSFRNGGQANESTLFKTEPDAIRAKRLSFAEDFLLEHSSSNLRVAMIEILASASATPREPQKSAQSFGFPS